MEMEKDEKQGILLQHTFNYLEYYKSLRIKIPVVICGLIIGVTGFILDSSEIPSSALEKFLLIGILLILGSGGIITYKAIQEQYNDILEDIIHIQKMMGITGEDYYPPGKEPSKENKMYRAAKLWFVGYSALVLITIVAILLILINK